MTARKTGDPLSILFISEQLPWPKDSGGNLRTFHILEALSNHFDVTLVTSARSESEAARGREKLGPISRQVVVVPSEKSTGIVALARTAARSWVARVPITVQYNFSRSIAACVEDLVAREQFDFVHLNHIDTAPYAASCGDIPRVVDTHNLLYQYYERRATLERNPAMRLLFGREARRFKEFEFEAFRSASHVMVCSREEADVVHRAAPEIAVEVVPNGVDCTFFQPDPNGTGTSSLDLVFVGHMAYRPNHDAAVWFIENVLPRLRQKVPGVRFVVVGKNPDRSLLDLGSDHPDVIVTGTVEDVRQHIWSSRIAVVPIRYGSGTRLKVLEAFAMGIPTVSTAVGAEGIAYRDGVDILIADEPDSIIDAICRLLSDTALYESIGSNGRKTAVERYDWSIIGRQVVAIYRRLLERSAPASVAHQQTP